MDKSAPPKTEVATSTQSKKKDTIKKPQNDAQGCYFLKTYVRPIYGDLGFAEIEYDGVDDVVIFTGMKEAQNKIWIPADSLDEMIKELKEFSKKLKKVRG